MINRLTSLGIRYSFSPTQVVSGGKDFPVPSPRLREPTHSMDSDTSVAVSELSQARLRLPEAIGQRAYQRYHMLLS